MIILRLSGGLGNQMFQLGAALLLAKSLNVENITIDDTSLNSYKVERQNNLTSFFDFSLSPIPIQFSSNLITRLRLPRLFPLRLKYWPLISDRNFSYALKSKYFPILLLDGYFQKCLGQEDFDDITKLLSQMFILQLLDDVQDKCVIHIRGGDFLKLGWDSVTPIEYYCRAIKHMSENYLVKEFLIVTDDTDYAEQIMSDSNTACQYKLIGGGMIYDFQIIASVKRRIISNSTFALWASSLGKTTGSFIIAPKFFRPGLIRPFSLIGETELCF